MLICDFVFWCIMQVTTLLLWWDSTVMTGRKKARISALVMMRRVNIYISAHDGALTPQYPGALSRVKIRPSFRAPYLWPNEILKQGVEPEKRKSSKSYGTYIPRLIFLVQLLFNCLLIIHLLGPSRQHLTHLGKIVISVVTISLLSRNASWVTLRDEPNDGKLR